LTRAFAGVFEGFIFDEGADEAVIWGGDSWRESRGEEVRCGAPGYVVYSLGESVLKKEISDKAPTGRAKQRN